MKVTLIHNPSAGDANPKDGDDIVAMIQRVGHRVAYHSTKDKDWQAGLEAPADLVAIAGGDGAVRNVACRVLREKIPLAVLPRGMANNIARTLGLLKTPLPMLIKGWTEARHKAFDIGIAKGPWGKDTFLEGIGTGLFAWAMQQYDKHNEKKGREPKGPRQQVHDARRYMRQHLRDFASLSLDITLDDSRRLSGQFLLVEIMNVRSIGPNLALAPEADPGDGLFDVVLVMADEHDKLAHHLGRKPEKSRGLPDFDVHRAKRLHVHGEFTDIHVDDRHLSNRDDKHTASAFSVEVSVKKKALTFLVPNL
jgi:diacylglycerol kinase family enzyme